jgi:FixJ family two-component response regulator
MSRPVSRPRPAADVVYVVDDDDAVRTALGRVLRSADLDAVTFDSAAAFLAHRRVDGPACLVLDVRLVDGSGLDLQSRIGDTEHELPIIFLTGYRDVPVCVRAMKGGAVDFLLKPCSDDELLDAIQRALARSRAARAERAGRRTFQERFATLTPREREVLTLVITGLLNKQIAAELGNAEKTVKIHRGRVMKKMRVDSVAELVRMTEKAGLGTDG